MRMKKVLLTALLISGYLSVTAQWSDNPAENNRITPLGTEIYDHEIKVSNDGTSFIVFNRPTGGNTATFLQIIDINGNMLFSDQGMLISNKQTLSWTMVDQLLFIDDDGNAIIVVVDCRHSAGYDISYTLYKVSPTGEMLWDDDGLDLCGGMAYGTIGCMNIVQLEDGSYVCAWMVEGSNLYIQLQRISKSGELLWNEEDVRLYNSSIPHDYPYLVNAGDNQVILVFSRGPLFSRNVRARKIDIDGTSVWADDLSIYSGSFGYTPLWVIIRVIPDRMGGAFVGWFDDRNSTLTESTYIAHVTSDGTHGFPSGEGGEKIGYSPLRSFFPEMYFDKEEGFLYAAFRETNDNQVWQQMKAQKIKIPSGELMWDPEGIDVSPLLQDHSISFYTVQNGGNGNKAVFFTSNTWHPEHLYGWDINNVTLINGNGEYVWKDEIIEFSNPVGFKGSLLSTPLVNNAFWLTAWNDDRIITGDPGGSKKIYMQRINIDGTLGNMEFICLPPANLLVDNISYETATVTWDGEADDYELSYRIVDEEWIYINVTGSHTFAFENLTPNTDYTVRVRAICQEDQTSEWTETISFTTLDTPPPPPCEEPINLNVIEITETSAKLLWEEGDAENMSWDLRYREASSASWNNAEALEVCNYTLTQLAPNTAYLWTVRANCSEDRKSEWATENDFTTDDVGINDATKDRMTVYATGNMINVINPDNRYIEKIQFFSINGSLLGNYTIKSAENVIIPVTTNETVIIVKIIGENQEESHKIVSF